MSLSSLLLKPKKGKGAAIDNDLDALFSSSAPLVQKPPVTAEIKSPVIESPTRKRKLVEEVAADDVNPSDLVHESLQNNASTRSKRKRPATGQKYVPADETPEQRDLRTIFIGNLPVEVAQKRPLLKQLQRHILSHVPSAKIESTRLRSVPFSTPTSKLSASDDESGPSKPSKNKSEPARQHERERASSWRQSTQTSADDSTKMDEKKFLTPKEKKKIAFINHEFHQGADSVNAYIVFAHALPKEIRPSNVAPPPPAMDPKEAARLAVITCNGTIFMERMIRVDHVSGAVNFDRNPGEEDHSVESDPKLCVFVGNLDFAAKEEDLRQFFEGTISAERGPPSTSGDDETIDQMNPATWVTRVRLIRDKESQLGKGFAYVQFADRECVDEVLALDEGRLKFAKRKLRVQRCKTLTGIAASAARASRSLAQKSSTSPKTPSKQNLLSMPKGDPTLGDKLVHLSKDERKKVKSSDADRVARRLAKKKARNALAKDGIKPHAKERERVRKSSSTQKGSNKGSQEKKGRIRSDQSLSRRNVKK